MMRLVASPLAVVGVSCRSKSVSKVFSSNHPSATLTSFFSTQGDRGGSSASAVETESSVINSVYVHHVTKVVLQHLQETKAEWIIKQGLDRGLHINPNGTATLQFPPRMGFDGGRIWTTYDASTKRHWLCVYRGKLVGRFLLKDTNSTTPFTTKQTSERAHQVDRTICRVVDEMVRKLSHT